jgi:hypothetical protein
MAYGTPTDPVAGTVITVAYAVANLLNPIRALRDFTGGSDPPGSNYWLRSTSTTAVSWVARSAEVLAALGYTPVNSAGDTMTGDLTLNNTKALHGKTTGGVGQWLIGLWSDEKIYVGDASQALVLDGTSISLDVNTSVVGALTVSGNIASSTGNVTAAATISAGANVSATGNVTAGSTVAATGNVTAGGNITTTTGTVAGDVVNGVSDVRINNTSVSSLFAATGHSHGTSGTVPSGLVAMFRTNAAIASGWTRETNLDGRIPVGAGTTFTVTYVENTAYGSSWSHAHTAPTHQHSGSSLGISGNTGGPTDINGLAAAGGVNLPTTSHTHDAGSLDVSGNTADGGGSATTSDAWVIPSRAYVFAIKS